MAYNFPVEAYTGFTAMPVSRQKTLVIFSIAPLKLEATATVNGLASALLANIDKTREITKHNLVGGLFVLIGFSNCLKKL
jgi:hypothetical protein